MHRIFLVLLACGLAQQAQAQQPVDTFAKCLAENTTGRDRKDLARWVFVAMGAHPEMRAIATLPASAAEQASVVTGQLFTRLVAESCAAEAKTAVKAVGPSAIQSAFAVLGQLAMQELMTDKDVSAAMGAVEKHIDAGKIQAVFGSP